MDPTAETEVYFGESLTDKRPEAQNEDTLGNEESKFSESVEFSSMNPHPEPGMKCNKKVARGRACWATNPGSFRLLFIFITPLLRYNSSPKI
jgi:hypothetical protein